MSTYRATVDWRCEGDFASRRYSRVHQISFDGGLTVPGTAGPANVNPRYSMEGAMDPEQAFVASLSACHMLWFLDLAARAGFVAATYRDEAEGTLAPGPDGKQTMTRVMLRPRDRVDRPPRRPRRSWRTCTSAPTRNASSPTR